MKRFALLLFASTLFLALFLVTGRAEAAQCYRGAAGVYVCDARQEPQIFSAPSYRPNSIFFNRTYSWLDDGAPLYKEPKPGAEIAKEGTVGLLYYTIEQVVTDASGAKWYKVGDEEYARAEDMHIYNGTHFTGLEVKAQPERPFGWVMQKFQPLSAPDEEPAETAGWVERYTFVEIYDVAEGDEGWLWFDIGDGQWVKQTYVALVDVTPRPEDVGDDEYWVEVDLFEQTFAAYEGDRMVYAGMVSTGLDGFETNEGLFTVYARHREWPMWGGDVGKDYYFLQEVPHTMFFDNDIALHGAYWHDGFGAPRSHGCVNMTPRDAEWVYYWSDQAPNEDLWVYVHTTPQDYFLQTYGDVLTTTYGPVTMAR